MGEGRKNKHKGIRSFFNAARVQALASYVDFKRVLWVL